MKKLSLIYTLLLATCIAQAKPGVAIVGTQQATIPLTKLTAAKRIDNKKPSKTISLLKLKLSPQFSKQLQQHATKMQIKKLTGNPQLTLADFDQDLTMNNVPVFDQGEYGTCVTFATTAAIDADKNIGHYISQQCNLELGVTLEKDHKIESSGWDGSLADITLNQMNSYGIVNNNNCPDTYPHPDKQLTEKQFTDLGYKQFAGDIKWRELPAGDIQAVIDALNRQHRVVIGSIIMLDQVAGFPVNNYPNGLWTLQYVKSLKDICKPTNNCAGHEIIITGYNSKDRVFKIRNSWGNFVGELGNFYMTYDYYQLLDLDAHEII